MEVLPPSSFYLSHLGLCSEELCSYSSAFHKEVMNFHPIKDALFQEKGPHLRSAS